MPRKSTVKACSRRKARRSWREGVGKWVLFFLRGRLRERGDDGKK